MALPNVPQSRNEKYLAKIAGQEVELPNQPLSREEQYLDYIAKNGGGGGGYVLPTATESRLGGVKIGSGINVEEDGAISADIPTKVSDLDNDENFISDADYVHTDNNYDDTAKGIVNGVTEALAGKQDELTFDNIPTENSTNPVKSGGVYSADEAIRQWTTAEAKSVSGNPITLTDGSARNAEGLVVTCNPKQNLHGYDHPWAGGAGKNKLPMVLADIKSANTDGTWSGNTYTYRGISFEVKTDEAGNVTSIVANGTSDTDFATLNIADLTLPAGSYIISGSVGGAVNSWRVVFAGDIISYDGDSAFTLAESKSGVAQVVIRRSGTTVNNLTFYPMIRLASVSDATFEPYSNECPITGYTECVVDRDGKNLLPMTVAGIKALNTNGTWNGNTYIVKGVSFKLLTDEAENITGVNVDGTASGGNATLYLYRGDMSAMSSIIMSGCPSNGGNNTFCLTAQKSSPPYTIYGRDIGSGVSLSGLASDTQIFIAVFENTSMTNNIFYPMIRLASVSDETFVPYSHDTATITFGQTVYGGSVDFKTGKVTVTHKLKQFDGSESWNENTNGYLITRGNGGFTDIKIASSANTPIITNMFQNGSTTWTNGKAGVDNGTLWIGDANQSTYGGLAAFKTFLSNNNLQMAYPLETPVELTLTPAELELLKGYNYITTNGTTIALNYLPDSLLAEAENYVDDADSVLNAKIDEIDGRVDSIEAMTYHTDSSGTKTVTLTNVYQQVFISISIVNTRTIYLVAQQKATASIVETIFSTAGKTPIDIAVTHVSDNSFAITLPQYAQTNIFSTEPFSVE